MIQRALKAGKDDAVVLASVALPLAHLTGDQVAGQAFAARATDLNPGSSVAWYSRGALHLLNGEADLAVEAMETCLRLDPMGPSRTIQIAVLGHARVLQGRHAEAVGLLKEAIQVSELASTPLFLAVALVHLGELEAAGEALARFRRLSSLSVEEFVRSTYRSASSVALILEGIALAEGKRPDGAVS